MRSLSSTKISIDWEHTLYLGLTLKWDYKHHTVNLSMPGYVKDALHKFQHPSSARQQDAPHSWNQPTYGATVQYTDNLDNSPLLPTKSITFVQKIVGTFLYYTTAVNPTMLVALSSISSTQAKATEKTYADTLWLLNYAASHPAAVICSSASKMVLHILSNVSYRSHAGGHYFLSNRAPNPAVPPTTLLKLNGPLFTISRIMCNVMGSAAEAEIGTAYINGQEAIPIHTTLEEMGHPQPPTPMQVNDSTAEGFANNDHTIKQK
jgi:hypothetical protein